MGLLVCSQCGSFLTVHPFIQPFSDLLSWYNNCVNWLLEAIWDFNRFSALGGGILLPLYFHHPCPLSPQGQVHSFPLLALFCETVKGSRHWISSPVICHTTLAAIAVLVRKKNSYARYFLRQTYHSPSQDKSISLWSLNYVTSFFIIIFTHLRKLLYAADFSEAICVRIMGAKNVGLETFLLEKNCWVCFGLVWFFSSLSNYFIGVQLELPQNFFLERVIPSWSFPYVL